MDSLVSPAASRQRRKPTKTGVVLDEEMIVTTALRMVEEHGPAGLSTRRLGRVLGADHTAIYRYFRNMDELELALTDELIARVTQSWQPTGDWEADLRRWGLSAHAEYMKHPQTARISATRISGLPAELAAVDTILATLRGAGFSDVQAVTYYQCFITQMLSYAAWDGTKKLMPQKEREADIARWKGVYAQASPEHYPHIAATSGLMGQLKGLDTYPLALQILLDSMRATLAHTRYDMPVRK